MKKTSLMMTLLLVATAIFGIISVDGQDVDLGTYVEGTVTDAVTGEPLYFAMVEVWGPGGGWGVSTDSEGFYRIELDVRVQGEYDIFCYKSGYYDEYTTFEIRRGDTEVVDFALEPMNATVKGYIKDSETMEPLEYAYVNLYSTEPGGESQWVQTDEDGYFKMTADPGYYKLIVGYTDYKRYMSEEFYLDDGDIKEVEILLEKITTGIYGVVSNNEGMPVGDAVIYLYTHDYQYWFSAMTDRNGNYEIRAPPGEYIIDVRAEDHFQYTEDVMVEEDDLTEYDVELIEITIPSALRYVFEIIMDIIGLAQG